MLNGVANEGDQQRDYRSLGLLMIRLMERSTSLEDPDSVELRNPELWDQQIRDFLKETSNSSGETLQKVGGMTCIAYQHLLITQNDFLDFSPESHWLKPVVLITERMVQRDWEPCLMRGKDVPD